MNDNTDRRRNERVTSASRKVYIVASVIICACLILLSWGI